MRPRKRAGGWRPSEVAASHRMRRWVFFGGLLLAILVAALLMVAASEARADERIVAGATNRYATPNVTMDQGERLTFRNLDVNSHDVTSRLLDTGGKPLFSSPIIGTNQEALVEGSQYLTTGSYGFYCSVHPSIMQGTLTVSSAGAPVPRPALDSSPPVLEVALLARPLGRIARTSKLPITAGVKEPANATFKATIRRQGRKVTIAKGSHAFGQAGSRSFSLVVNRTARAILRRASRVTVTLSGRAEDKAGNVSTAKATRTLKR